MSSAINKIDIYLQPGEFYFGNKETRIKTLLGSCIAITLWHPQKLIGGMCHYMLPSPEFRTDPLQLNCKYAEDAIKMFLQEIRSADTLPTEYQAKVFGGGNMFSKIIAPPHCNPRHSNCFESSSCNSVACRNSIIAPYLLKKHGFKIAGHDIGGTQHRKIIFEAWSGNVWLSKGS